MSEGWRIFLLVVAALAIYWTLAVVVAILVGQLLRERQRHYGVVIRFPQERRRPE